MQGQRSISPTIAINRNWGTLLLALLGLATIALAVYRFQSHGSRLPLMMMCALGLGILVVVYPTVGLYATVVAAGFVRVTVSTGTDTPIVASLVCAGILCIGWIIHQILHRRRIIMLPRAIAVPALGLMGFMIFALFWGRITLDPRIFYYAKFLRVQLAGLGLVIISVGLLFVGADLFSKPRARIIVAGVIIFMGLIYLPMRVVLHHVPVLETGGLFGMWFFALTWSQALANKSLPPIARFFLAFAAVAFMVDQFIIRRSWVSGWLPMGVAFIVITSLVRPRLGIASFVLIIGYMFVFSNQATQIWKSEEAQGSAAGSFSRIQLWERNLHILGNDVVLGTGPATYALYYMAFDPTQAMSTHNNYMDILDESGIAGLTSLLALLAGLWFVGRRTMRKISDPTDQALALAAVGGVAAAGVAMMFGDWVIPFVYNQTIAGFDHSVYTWLMFAILCGLAAQYFKTERSRA